MASPPTYVRRRGCCTSSRSVAATASYARLLVKYAKLDLLAIDDWLLAPLTDAERRDLLEVIEDRSERALDAHRQPAAADRVARRDWRAQRRRCDLRPGDPSGASADAERARPCATPGRDAAKAAVMIRLDRVATGIPQVDSVRRSSLLGHPGRSSIDERAPVDRAASMEIAQNAIPTPAWTAPRTRRPQRPTGPHRRVLRRKNEVRKMTRLRQEGGARALTAVVASLR